MTPPENTRHALLSADRLCLGFGEVRLSAELSLSISRNECAAVIGPSGCGKSTLLRALSGLLEPVAGKVIAQEGLRTSFVFQSPNLLPWLSAVENVRLPSTLGRNPQPVSREEAAEALLSAGLADEHFGKNPARLSGGMKMRVSLARALVTQPQLIFMDEPLSALDDFLRHQLQREIRRLQETRGMAFVLVTHSIDEAVVLSDRILMMHGDPARFRPELPVDPGDRLSPDLRTSEQFLREVARVTQWCRDAA